MKKKYFIYLFASFLFLCSSAMQSTAQGFVTIKGRQFYDSIGNPFYPLLCNYIMSVTFNLADWNAQLINPSNASDMYFTPSYNYGDTFDFECGVFPQLPCLQQMGADFEKISAMGFDCVRLTSNLRYHPFMNDITLDTLITDKFYITAIPNSQYYPMLYEFNKPYATDTNVTRFMDLLEEVIDLAGTHNLKVMIDMAGDIYNYPSAVADYNELLQVYANKFNGNQNLMAYIIIEEPALTDGLAEHTKENICYTVKSFYDTLKLHDPNHLITIGGFDAVDLREWDPSLLKIDFYHPHLYIEYRGFENNDFTAGVDRMKGRLWWLYKNCPMPWMIGEVGFRALAGYPASTFDMDGSEAEQSDFAEIMLGQTLNCGGSGLSWWDYQDSHQFQATPFDGFGLIRDGLMPSPPVTTYDKPAVQKFIDFANSPPAAQPCLKPSNYYDPYNTGTFNTTSFHAVSGTLLDQNSDPVEDAWILALNWLETIHHPFPLPDTYNYIWIYTYSDASGDLEIIPYNNINLGDDRIIYITGAALGTEKFEKGQPHPWGDVQMQTNIGSINLKRKDFKYDATVSENVGTGITKNFKGWNSITVNNSVIDGNSEIRARLEINVNTEFHASNTSEVHIYTDETFSECDDYTGYTTQRIINASTLEPASSSVREIEMQFKIKNEAEFTAEIIPNPNSGLFTIKLSREMKDKPVVTRIKNPMAENLKELTTLGNEIIIDVGQIAKGIYFVEINAELKVITKKLIIN